MRPRGPDLRDVTDSRESPAKPNAGALPSQACRSPDIEIRGRGAGRRRVLVIEDNGEAAESLREVLEFGGHTVAIARTGFEGLEKARGFDPEIVLCDIGLPRMNGYQVAQAFKADESLQGILLVALSGHAFAEDVQRAVEAGFARHLAKPPSLETLEEILASL